MDKLIMLAKNVNINMFLDFLEELLKSTGGMHDIKLAINTKDLATTVRAAKKALKKLGIPEPFSGYAYVKSVEESNKFRKEGNLHYINQDYKNAIVCYNKALAYAPNNSVEVKLAYSNISAVMLNIKAYQACKINIEAAEELYCPEFLYLKLKKRKIEADKHISEEIWGEIWMSQEDMPSYFNFDVPRNAAVPCASTDVYVDDDKKVVAAKEIKSGTVVAMERAFVSFQDEINEYTSCYYCHKMCFFFIPCEGCCWALFCSKQCREKCLADYHRIECQIVDHMHVESNDINQHLNKLAVRAAIRMSMKLGWEQLGVASLEMGEELFKKSSVAEAFDSNNPTSVLCYDDQTEVPEDVMINRSLVSAMTVHWLSRIPGYLPEDEEEREKAIDTLSRIILHLNTTFMAQIAIPCSAIDYEKHNYSLLRCMAEVQRNIGWFSFTSKLAHSCEPNLLVVGLNDHVALVALQRIKEGEQLTICYTEHFYDMNILPCSKNSRIRQKLIFKLMEYTCKCRVCLLEWHNGSQVEATLTNQQKEAYNKYKTAMDSADSVGQQMKAICPALDELSDCINTTQHRNLYADLRKTLSICQCVKDFNKSYGCVQTLHPYLNINDFATFR